MTTASEGYTLSIGDLRQVVPMAFPDSTVERQLATLLKSGDHEALSVRITAADEPDVEGHAFGSAAVSINVQLDDDDTEGHAISVHFPSPAEADQFRKRLMAVGLLAGTIAIGSVGAIAIANQPASTGAAIPGTAPAPITMQAPAGRGFFEGADISIAPAADAAVGSGTRGGLVEGADIGAPAAAGAAGELGSQCGGRRAARWARGGSRRRLRGLRHRLERRAVARGPRTGGGRRIGGDTSPPEVLNGRPVGRPFGCPPTVGRRRD